MTLETLNRFCGYSGWIKEPFLISKWHVATDGTVLVAELGDHRLTQLAELDAGNNRDMIIKWLNVPIPEEKYSTENLKGFLGECDDDNNFSEPMMFNGHRVDKVKLREVLTLAGDEYSFCPQVVLGGARLHFRFGKIIALVMGMREPSPDDPRYEPKLIQEKVLP